MRVMLAMSGGVDSSVAGALLLQQGAETIAMSPAEFAEFQKAEIAKWGKVIKERGIRASD